ncbi:MAG: hypothetical protein PHH80_09750 [Sphaerochaetaceae bacterium]|nr:hypothetical protein [Sphaerochaetaceae bacterium]
MKHIAIILMILSMLAAFIGCNMDATEGIFRQISKSEPIVDVGMTTILKIANSGADIYARTSKKGLVRYDVDEKKWYRLDDETPISHVLVASNGTDIMYTVFDETTWYKLDGSDQPIAQNLGRQPIVIGTSVYGGWELAAGTSSGSFDLYRDLTTKVVADLHNTFAAYPWLIAQDTTAGGIVLVTGLKAGTNDEYTHVLYDDSGVFATITTTGTVMNSPVVAFAYDEASTNLVAITSDGKVYGGTKSGAAFSMTASDSTVSFLVNGIAGKPIPSFIDSAKNLVIQGSSLFYSISPTKVVTQIQDRYASGLRASTFKVTSMILDGAVLYGGTTKNGIFKVPDLNDDTVSWL